MSFSMASLSAPIEKHVWTMQSLKDAMNKPMHDGPWSPISKKAQGSIVGDEIHFVPDVPKYVFITEISVSPFASETIQVVVTYNEPAPLAEFDGAFDPGQWVALAYPTVKFGDFQIKTNDLMNPDDMMLKNPCGEITSVTTPSGTKFNCFKFEFKKDEAAADKNSHFVGSDWHLPEGAQMINEMQELHGAGSVLFGKVINLETVHVTKATFPETCSACEVKFTKYTPIALQDNNDSMGITSRHIYCWIADQMAKKMVAPSEGVQALVDHIIEQSERITVAMLYYRERAATPGPFCPGMAKHPADHIWGCSHEDAPWNRLDITKEFEGVK